MVYFTLEVVLGVEVSREELEEITDVEEGGYVEDPEVANGVIVHSFPCCSKSNGKKYILGTSLHKYYRKITRCDKCSEYSVCDTCIGQTNNGHYDVRAIYSGPAEANIRHICLHCFHDNGRDLGAPKEDLPIVDNQCIGTQDPVGIHTCDVCNLKPDWRFAPETAIRREIEYERIAKFLMKEKLQKDIRFYYCIDDCLSCT